MLVYADKFAVVDPKSKILKSPFVVQTAGGKTQMALSGDFVADGLIHGRHIAAGQTLSSPSIEGGSLNIGGGRFSVSGDGALIASGALIRGRIEADSGYFKGTVKASRIEGDVMRLVRMKAVSSGVWEASVTTEDEPMLVRPDFEVLAKRDIYIKNQSPASFLVDGKPQEVHKWSTEHEVKTSFGWYVLPRNRTVTLRLNIAGNGQTTSPIPCLQTAFLLRTDDEYQALVGKNVWKRVTDAVRLNVGLQENGLWVAYYGIPSDIYGLRLKYLTDANTDWPNGIAWHYGQTSTPIKGYSKDNHSNEFRIYSREINQASGNSHIKLTAKNSWQWMELRDVEVLVPEDRVL